MRFSACSMLLHCMAVYNTITLDFTTLESGSEQCSYICAGRIMFKCVAVNNGLYFISPSHIVH